MPTDTRSELGDFLRSRRALLAPTTGGRRRTPGLRREEVAALAGISVDWYIRLEQGRSKSPSAATLKSLAKALGLDAVEEAHLHMLSKAESPRPFVRERATPAIRRVIESLPQPAYAQGRRWDVLAWNAAADDLFGLSRAAEEDRNILLTALTSPTGRTLFGAGWENEARRMAAQFRATHDLWADDPAFRSLLARLHAGCPELSKWWNAHDVRAPGAGKKTLFHPKRGALRFEFVSFQASEDPAIRLIILTPM